MIIRMTRRLFPLAALVLATACGGNTEPARDADTAAAATAPG